MREWDTSTKVAIYGLTLVIIVLATTLLFLGDNTLLSGHELKGEVLHSNYVLPHVTGEH